MKRPESKYSNTALLMDHALVALLNKKDFESITVKEICEKAGVHRSTFYLHYETIGDLLDETLEQTMEEFAASFPFKTEEFSLKIKTAPPEELILITSEYLRPYLLYVKAHQTLYQTAFSNPNVMRTKELTGSMYETFLLPILDRFHVPKDEQLYEMDFFISGCMAVVQRWVDNKCKEPPDWIEALLMHCIRPNFDAEKE